MLQYYTEYKRICTELFYTFINMYFIFFYPEVYLINKKLKSTEVVFLIICVSRRKSKGSVELCLQICLSVLSSICPSRRVNE